jgi:hypothetical protein
MDIDIQHEDDDFQLNIKRGSSIDAFDPWLMLGLGTWIPKPFTLVQVTHSLDQQSCKKGIGGVWIMHNNVGCSYY